MGFSLPKLKVPSVKTVAKNVAVTPLAGLYALGGGINTLTGGKTATYNVYKAVNGTVKPTKYSKPTQALSGYQGDTPNGGNWGLPLVNRSSASVVGDVTSTIVREVVAPTADAAAKGLFGVSLPTLAWIAGGGVLGLGGVYVATR